MPPAYVRALFDQYAPKFEAALVDDLGYRGPALLFKAVLAARAAVRKPAFFKRAIDLGCGTGLAATAFAREVDHFIGIDLSPRMIERARAPGFMRELEVAEMVQGLRGKPDASADLILAADAMVYRVRSRAGAARGGARAGRPAACWRSRSKPMAAMASSSARACATRTARLMCAPRSRLPAWRCRGSKSCRPATRTTRRCPVSWWSRPRPDFTHGTSPRIAGACAAGYCADRRNVSSLPHVVGNVDQCGSREKQQ